MENIHGFLGPEKFVIFNICTSMVKLTCYAVYILRLEVLIKHFREVICHDSPFLIIIGLSDFENFTLITISNAVTYNLFHAHLNL